VAPLAKWLLVRPALRAATVEGDWSDGAVVFRPC
jgi:hypothetical protein